MAWVKLVRKSFGLGLVQFSLDLLDPKTEQSSREQMIDQTRRAVEEFALQMHSTFTGLGAYSSNLLLHPNLSMRMDALGWYEQAIRLSSELVTSATGGHFGALSCCRLLQLD